MSKLNPKRIRNFLIVFFIIIYVGVFIFEGILGFNQNLISNLLMKYEDFLEPLYVVFLTVGIATGLLTAIIVFAGFFFFNLSQLILLVAIGVILGISVTFILARLLGHDAFMRYLKVREKRSEKLKEIFLKDSVALTVLFNFIFFLPSTFGGIVGGLTEVKLQKFIPISIIGNLINQIAFIFLLYGAQTGKTGILFFSVIVLILNTLIPIIIYRKNIKDVFSVAFRKN